MRINLNTNIASFFGVRQILGNRYGLELEYEGAKLDRLPTGNDLTRWKVTKDDSLRNNGIEFISRPIGMARLPDYMSQLDNAVKKISCEANIRCGLHVHVNMTHRNFGELYNAIVLYTLLEPRIFREFAPGREISHFCVPLFSNTVLTEWLYNDVQSLRNGLVVEGKKKSMYTKKATIKKPGMNPQVWPGEPIAIDEGDAILPMEATPPPQGGGNSVIDPYAPGQSTGGLIKFTQAPKYSAVNYNSLRRFGTIEYRQHPSTTDMAAIVRWVTFLDRLHTVAYEWSDPLEILQYYDDEGPAGLCRKVGLPFTTRIDPLDVEDAVDAATMIAGYNPIDWQELKWEIK